MAKYKQTIKLVLDIDIDEMTTEQRDAIRMAVKRHAGALEKAIENDRALAYDLTIKSCMANVRHVKQRRKAGMPGYAT